MSPLPQLNSAIIHAIYILCTLCASQSKICVWNSHDSHDHYNGEYILAADTQLNKPYWIKSSTCPSTTHYVMYVEDKRDDFWQIGDTLRVTYVSGEPYCEKPTPSNPTLCNTGWYSRPHNVNNYGLLSLTVTDGECPISPCEKIKLTNTGYTQCDKVFVKDNNMKNVFINGMTYLYFNKHTFKWYCSDTLGIDECADDNSITHFYISSQNDGWDDMNIGQSDPWILNNGNTATIECIGATKDPTVYPTTNRLNPSNIPTLNPSNIPTMILENPERITLTPIPASNPTLRITHQLNNLYNSTQLNEPILFVEDITPNNTDNNVRDTSTFIPFDVLVCTISIGAVCVIIFVIMCIYAILNTIEIRNLNDQITANMNHMISNRVRDMEIEMTEIPGTSPSIITTNTTLSTNDSQHAQTISTVTDESLLDGHFICICSNENNRDSKQTHTPQIPTIIIAKSNSCKENKHDSDSDSDDISASLLYKSDIIQATVDTPSQISNINEKERYVQNVETGSNTNNECIDERNIQ